MHTGIRTHAPGFTGFLLASSCLFVFFVDPLAAQTPRELTYWQDIRPVFRKHCTVCHSTKYAKEDDISGGLALDTYGAVRKGAKQPIIQPGKSGASLLIHMVELSDAKKRMPLDAAPLTAEKIALIRRWIDTGAKEGTKPDGGPEPVVTRKAV